MLLPSDIPLDLITYMFMIFNLAWRKGMPLKFVAFIEGTIPSRERTKSLITAAAVQWSMPNVFTQKLIII